MSFRETVYQIAREIPKGKVATYGQLAKLAGRPKAARAVGYYMRTNPDAPRIPCHRIVASDGSLVGYSAGKGIQTKKAMLIGENIKFIGERVDLKVCLWRR